MATTFSWDVWLSAFKLLLCSYGYMVFEPFLSEFFTILVWKIGHVLIHIASRAQASHSGRIVIQTIHNCFVFSKLEGKRSTRELLAPPAFPNTTRPVLLLKPPPMQAKFFQVPNLWLEWFAHQAKIHLICPPQFCASILCTSKRYEIMILNAVLTCNSKIAV